MTKYQKPQLAVLNLAISEKVAAHVDHLGWGAAKCLDGPHTTDHPFNCVPGNGGNPNFLGGSNGES